jgi:hypothetical protein
VKGPPFLPYLLFFAAVLRLVFFEADFLLADFLLADFFDAFFDAVFLAAFAMFSPLCCDRTLIFAVAQSP